MYTGGMENAAGETNARLYTQEVVKVVQEKNHDGTTSLKKTRQKE